MNARGYSKSWSTTIGLTMGVLNQQLFTVMLLMAVATTICMPPLLRGALARVPIRDEEQARLETEAAEEKDVLPKLKSFLLDLTVMTMAGLPLGLGAGSRCAACYGDCYGGGERCKGYKKSSHHYLKA